MKQKIIISKWIPEECLAPYLDEFDFTMPQFQGGEYSHEEIMEMIPEYDGYLDVDRYAPKEFFDRATKLKAIANFGVGYDKIDWKYATEIGMPVLNTPTQVTEATAELSIALMMAVMRRVPLYDRETRKHIWASPLFSDLNTLIYGSTLGIIGFGRIGKAVCKKAKGLGMEVVYYDKYRASEEVEKEYGVKYMPMEELIKISDCVSLHAPYFPENFHMFNAETFAMMKPGAYFINAARGKLVDEVALCEALKNGVIKGAGLDVYENEPEIYEGLLELDNVVMTPHIASLTMRSRVNMAKEALEGLVTILRGGIPHNVVNPQVLKK